MPTAIRNPGLEPVSLPYPFRGVLPSGKSVLLNLPATTVIAALGGTAFKGGLEVTSTNDVGPFDSFYAGDAAGTPVTGLSLLISGDGSITGTTTLNAAVITSETVTTSNITTANITTLNATAGYRETVAPFAEALAASQTANVVNFGGVAVGYVATRAGHVTGLSAALSAALTGAGTNAVVTVAKNGVALVTTPTLTFTQAGAEVALANTVAAGAGNAFVAGDVLTVIYTSGAITNTPTLVAALELNV